MENAVALFDLDDCLRDLLYLLHSNAADEQAASAVETFVDEHTSDWHGPRSLFRPECKQYWRQPVLAGHTAFASAWVLCIKELDDRQKDALIEVCCGSLRFIVDGNTLRTKSKHRAELAEFIADYLDLRGVSVTCSTPSVVDKQDGPGDEEGIFYWHGKGYQMPYTTWLFARALRESGWDDEIGGVPVDEVGTNVWGENWDESKVRSTQNRVNNWFVEHGVPWKLKAKGGRIYREITPS